MIIVPELQKVFILVPRTGSGSLYREIRRVYPKSMLLYRHMEADGCPRGYDRWERVGFVRHPVMRLWSLYNFMRTFNGGAQKKHQGDIPRIHEQASRPFEDWLLNNREPWTVPFSFFGEEPYAPILARVNTTPENRASQFDWLRPDLGTKVLKFQDIRRHMHDWGLDANQNSNMTVKHDPPVTPAVMEHIRKFCAWDLEQNCEWQ